MRLKQYITEGSDKQFQWIKKNCSHILKHYEQANPGVILGFRRATLFEGLETALFRGAGGSHSVLIKKPRLRSRKPKDTPQIIHDLLNIIFKKSFGWPVRNGLPVSSEKSQTNQYIRDTGGQVYTVFPTNGFEMCYGKEIIDLWMSLDNMFEFDSDIEFPFDETKAKFGIYDEKEASYYPDDYYTFHIQTLKNIGLFGEPQTDANMKKYIDYEYGKPITQFIKDKFTNIKSTSKKVEGALMDHGGEVFIKCKQYALVTDRVMEDLLRYLKWDEK